jgi:hypothetical protein
VILPKTKSATRENDHQELSFGHGKQCDMEIPKTTSFDQIFSPHNEKPNSFTHTSEPRANRAQEQNEIKARTSEKNRAESRTKQQDTRTRVEEKGFRSGAGNRDQGGGATAAESTHGECLELRPGLTNLANFTEIRQIRSPQNFKIGDSTVHGFKIFEKLKKCKKN